MQPPKLTPEQVAALCPDFTDIVEIGFGGFKTAFRANKQGKPEVIKVFAIPRTDGSEGQERFREECLSRIRREVAILARCATPCLVKLASRGHHLTGFTAGRFLCAGPSDVFRDSTRVD